MDGLEALMAALAPREAQGPRLCPGEVLEAGKVGGKPRLRVQGNGLPLEVEDLRVDPRLRWDWEPEEDRGQVDLLRPGEEVLLLTQDGQTYYLLCKVVAP